MGTVGCKKEKGKPAALYFWFGREWVIGTRVPEYETKWIMERRGHIINTKIKVPRIVIVQTWDGYSPFRVQVSSYQHFVSLHNGSSGNLSGGLDWAAKNCKLWLCFKDPSKGKLTGAGGQNAALILAWKWRVVTEIWERAQERLPLLQTSSERTSWWETPSSHQELIQPRRNCPSGLQGLSSHQESPVLTPKSHPWCSSAWTTCVITSANWFGSFPNKGKIALQVKDPSRRYYPGLTYPGYCKIHWQFSHKNLPDFFLFCFQMSQNHL